MILTDTEDQDKVSKFYLNLLIIKYQGNGVFGVILSFFLLS